MPFDNPDIRIEIENQNAAALELIDKTAALLADPDRWGKFMLLSSIGEFCLIGALAAADGRTIRLGQYDTTMRTAAGKLVRARLAKLARRSAVEFNDDNTTEHSDVLALLTRARVSFE